MASDFVTREIILDSDVVLEGPQTINPEGLTMAEGASNCSCDLLSTMLVIGAMDGLRQDGTVSRQIVANFGASSHLMNSLSVINAFEMSIPESIAVQGYNSSQTPREYGAFRALRIVPQQDGAAA